MNDHPKKVTELARDTESTKNPFKPFSTKTDFLVSQPKFAKIAKFGMQLFPFSLGEIFLCAALGRVSRRNRIMPHAPYHFNNSSKQGRMALCPIPLYAFSRHYGPMFLVLTTEMSPIMAEMAFSCGF